MAPIQGTNDTLYMVVVALALVAFTSTEPTESRASSAALTSAAAALNSRLALESPGEHTGKS